VPDETVDLPPNQRVILHVERYPETLVPPVHPQGLIATAGSISKADASEMLAAIERGCGQIVLGSSAYQGQRRVSTADGADARG
jgi:hypothetical protein